MWVAHSDTVTTEAATDLGLSSIQFSLFSSLPRRLCYAVCPISNTCAEEVMWCVSSRGSHLGVQELRAILEPQHLLQFSGLHLCP